MEDYAKNAERFAKKYGVKLTVLEEDWRVNEDWGGKDEQYYFKCRLTRGRKQYTFDFWMGPATSGWPTMYDVLACLSKPYGIESFEDFCNEYGYDYDSRRAERIFKAYKKEVANVERLFGDVMDELYEIN